MGYINFEEEKAVVNEQLSNRKKNNETFYKDATTKKIELNDYDNNSKYSYNKIKDKLIGKDGIFDEQDFYEIVGQDIICAKFRKCDFKNIKFKDCTFIGCTFNDCNFSGGGVVFENCIFIKEGREKLPSLNKKDNIGCSFYNCDIYAKFLNSDLSYCIFEKCKISNTSFELTYLKSSIIIDSEIDMFEVIDCDLSGFKISNTYIQDIMFDDKFTTKFDDKTFFDKIEPRVKDKNEYEGIYMTYKTLSEKFKENNLNNNFGEYYYIGKCTQRKCVKFLPKINSYIYWLSCGYGERPWLCVLSSLVIMIIFAFIFLAVGIELDGQVIKYSLSNIGTWNLKQFIKDFNEVINLSVGMFGAVGFNNSKPTEVAYMVANIEMLLGIIMMGVGIGTLTRKVVR